MAPSPVYREKWILNWLRKKYKQRHFSQLAEELTNDEDSEDTRSSRLFCGVKLAAIALCAWLLIRKKANFVGREKDVQKPKT